MTNEEYEKLGLPSEDAMERCLTHEEKEGAIWMRDIAAKRIQELEAKEKALKAMLNNLILNYKGDNREYACGIRTTAREALNLLENCNKE